MSSASFSTSSSSLVYPAPRCWVMYVRLDTLRQFYDVDTLFCFESVNKALRTEANVEIIVFRTRVSESVSRGYETDLMVSKQWVHDKYVTARFESTMVPIGQRMCFFSNVSMQPIPFHAFLLYCISHIHVKRHMILSTLLQWAMTDPMWRWISLVRLPSLEHVPALLGQAFPWEEVVKEYQQDPYVLPRTLPIRIPLSSFLEDGSAIDSFLSTSS